MSPFSIDLRNLRDHQGLRQSELAAKLGYEQSYVSALEVGTKGPPTPEFVERLIECLALDMEWQRRLWEAYTMSQRKFVLPLQASPEMYRLCHELRAQIDRLHPAQIELIRFALHLRHHIDNEQAVRCRSSSQSKRQKVKEVAQM